MKTVNVLVFLSSISSVLLLNYAPPFQPLYLVRESAANPVVASAPFSQDGPEKQKNPSKIRETTRKLGIPYTIFYPLTFAQNRKGKNLNLKLQSLPLKSVKVESRIMNKPQPYPEFAVVSVKDDKKDIPGAIRNPFGKFPKDLLALPPSPQYISNDYKQNYPPQIYQEDTNKQNFPPRIYQDDANKQNFPPRIYQENTSKQNFPPRIYQDDTNKHNFPPQIYQEDTNKQNFPPQIYQEDTKGSSLQQKPKKPLKLRYVPPSAGYHSKNPPKYKILPLQMYNKVIVNPVAPPPPPVNNNQILQQWTSCICVPPYLCKDGILNSGGRLRQFRSFAYNVGNETSPYVQSKIINNPTSGRNDGICDTDKICCEVNLDDPIDNTDGGNHYPVAPPPPEIPYSGGSNPRYPPNNGVQYKKCGVRSAYGIQARLKQLRYSADVAEFGEYPWQVAILKKNVGEKNLYLCGGVLISPQWIASVAHCLIKEKGSPLLVRLGEWDVNRKDEVYQYVEKDVVGVIIHPEFDPESLQNDVTLVRMQDPVDPMIPHVTPACLPTPGQVYDKKCWVSGWGKDLFGPQGAYQNVLKEVDVPVVSRALCNAELRSTNLGPNFVLHNGFLCAGGEAGKDACTGDGGSPLVCQSGGQWYVVGLVSWGIGCGKPGIPGVYVNVLYYADWIGSIINR
ncbi:hypothetical protein JTE90_027398 [Oedothorax gibbosus]|uniref:Peptidase S1 domain-containing protein n=1 Tax=Oedothorax gibbosus TaxID=931172 RepID=A0AAV6W0W2_9ARAC|nr:hypothetical protein JTE90_027398 [Oedothorax gibbosus]